MITRERAARQLEDLYQRVFAAEAARGERVAF